MKARLSAGAEIDLLSPDDLRAVLGEFAPRFDRRGPQYVFPRDSLALDGSGNGTLKSLYDLKVGYTFTLHRLVVNLDPGTAAYSFGNPYSNASGWLEIRKNGHLEDAVTFDSTKGGGLPAIYTAGNAEAIRCLNAEKISVHVFGGPPNLNLLFQGQGTLQAATLE